MAALCGRTLRASTSSAAKTAFKNVFSKSSQPASAGTAFTSPTSSSSSSLRRLLSSPRLPVQLSCAQSLIPLHSATASALYTSLLSLHSNSWGCLSEGFATPL